MPFNEFNYDCIEVVCADLKIIFITDEKMTVTGKTGIHMHSFWELFYIRNGGLKVNTEERTYELGKDSMLLIPPNEYHSTESTTDSVKKSVLFTFEKVKTQEKESIFDKVNAAFCSCGFHNIDECGYIGLLLELILENHSLDKTGKRWRIKAGVTELMFAIYDNITEGNVGDFSTSWQPNTYWLYKYAIDRLLDIYYMSDITLEMLSERLFVSPKTVTRIISSAYGKTFNELKTELRMRNAKKLLRETEMTLSEISDSVGYTTLRGFLSAFRKYENCTPGDYREKNRR